MGLFLSPIFTVPCTLPHPSRLGKLFSHGPLAVSHPQEGREELTSPTNYIGLLPVFESCKARDVLLLLKGLELYQGAFCLDLLWRFTSNGEEGTGFRHMLHPQITLRDDGGTVYQAIFTRGSGGGRNQLQSYIVTPQRCPISRARRILS